MKEKIKNYIENFEIGSFKIWLGRMQGYLGIISFSLILYGMAIKNNLFGWSLEVWILLIIIGVPLVLWFDIKIVCPSELRYGFSLHPKMKEILEKTDKLIEKVDKLNENYIKDKKQKR